MMKNEHEVLHVTSRQNLVTAGVRFFVPCCEVSGARRECLRWRPGLPGALSRTWTASSPGSDPPPAFCEQDINFSCVKSLRFHIICFCSITWPVLTNTFPLNYILHLLLPGFVMVAAVVH